MYHLRTAGLFIVDNAYLPIHVAPHRPGTTVVQVWHAVGALKRFGADTLAPLAEPERTFLHRHYDFVVTTAESARAPYAAALRTPIERVLALGAPRTDFFFDESAMAAARARLAGGASRSGRAADRALRPDLPRSRPGEAARRADWTPRDSARPWPRTTPWSSRRTRTCRPPRRRRPATTSSPIRRRR